VLVLVVVVVVVLVLVLKRDRDRVMQGVKETTISSCTIRLMRRFLGRFVTSKTFNIHDAD